MMKTLKFLGLALALSFAVSARADTSKPFAVGTTNTLAASATQTANMGSVIDVRNWTSVSFLCQYDRLATNMGNVTLTFARTIDDPSQSTARWETTPRFTWVVPTVTPDVTNTVVGVTNLPADSISAIAGLKVISIQNGVAGVMTNFTLSVVGKNRGR